MIKKINPLIIIILLAFLLRIVYLFTFAQDLFFNTFSDASAYHSWAMKILSGNPPQPPFFMSPIYPYFLALIYSILGKTIIPVLLVQVILDTITTYLIFSLANLIFRKEVGLLAAFIYAIFPTAIFYSGLVLMPTLITFLFACSIYLLILAAKERAKISFMPSGLLFGITCLGRGNILLPALIPFFYFWRKKYILALFVPIVILFLVNITFGNELVVTTYNVGLNSYIGNNPDADGTYHRPGGLDLTHDPDGRKTISEITSRELTKSESSQYWLSQTAKFIKNNPAKFVLLSLKKIYIFWGPLEVSQLDNIYYAAKHTFLKYLPIGFWFVAPFFFTALITCRRKYPRLVILLIIGYFVSFLPFFIIGRFRQPIIPLMVILASKIIFDIVGYIKKCSYQRLILPGLFISIYIILSIINKPRTHRMILKTRSDHALWFHYHHHPRASYDTLKAVLRDEPKFVQGIVNLGNQFFWSRRFSNAQDLYKQALTIEPDNAEATVNLGVTYLALGKPDSGLYYLKKGKSYMPYNLKIDSMVDIARNFIQKN